MSATAPTTPNGSPNYSPPSPHHPKSNPVSVLAQRELTITPLSSPPRPLTDLTPIHVLRSPRIFPPIQESEEEGEATPTSFLPEEKGEVTPTPPRFLPPTVFRRSLNS
jgi:hypothetical protein